jgi:hypothetical protein
VRKHVSPGLVLGLIAIVVAMTGSAAASSLITSAGIKNGTIHDADIAKRTISLNRLTPAVQKLVRAHGATGPAGPAGAAGPKGDTGTTGASLQGATAPSPTAGNWGIIDRNTIGSPTATLRSGPAKPPFGSGSLNLAVADGTEKIAFGDEVDSFADGLVDNLSQIGFRVYTTGENNDAGHGAPNMPSIVFEIDPNVTGKTTNFSSLVYMPDASAPYQWSPYIDATKTGLWGLTGGQFAGTQCDINGARCTWDQVKAYLDDGGDPATILSAAVTKGRDYAWQGAVDGLRINGTVFDFEENGVFTHAAG